MKNYNKSVSIYNGNGQRYSLGVPKLFITNRFGNEAAKEHFEKNTGLKFKEYGTGYLAEPKTFKQLYKVFVTYDFVTTFYNNADFKNTLRLDFKTTK